MKIFQHLTIVAAAAMALSTASVLAENPGRGQGGRVSGESANDPTYLLTSASVQTELALTDDQKSSLHEIRSNEENGGHPFFGGLVGQPQQEIQRRIEEHATAVRNQIVTILSPQQLQRLDEINIQVVEAAALSYDDVAEKLALTADQRDQLKTLGDETRQRLAELNAPITSGQQLNEQQRQSHKTMQVQIIADRNIKALAILTDDQRAEFTKLRGEKFDISTIRPNHRSFNRRGRIDRAGVAAARNQ